MLRKRERPQDDPLRTFEGFLLGAVIGCLMWAAFVAICWSVTV